MSAIKIAVFCLGFSISIFIKIYLSDNFKHLREEGCCIRTENLAIDRYEDHMIAVNFALGDEFPVFGFAHDPVLYKFCDSKEVKPYFDLLKNQGPMVLFYRHPFYPFFMGIVYKIWGVNPIWDYIVVMIFFALMVGFLPYAGYKLMHLKGFFAGLGSSILCLYFYDPFFHSPLQHFTAFWGTICVIVSFTLNSRNSINHFIFGLLCAIALLSKSLFGLVALICSTVYIIAFIKNRSFRYLKLLTFFLIGYLIVFAPWFTFANLLNSRMEYPMKEWQSKIMQGQLNNNCLEKISSPETEFDSLELDCVLRNYLALYMNHAKFIVTTNQIAGNLLQAFHNELSVINGYPHYEWPILENIYYNKKKHDGSELCRVVNFYISNPKYIIQIPRAKLIEASSMSPHFFWLSMFLQGTFVFQYYIKKKVSGLYKNIFLYSIVILACVAWYVALKMPINNVLLAISLIFFIGAAFIFFTEKFKRFISVWVFNFSVISVMLLYAGTFRYLEFLKPIYILTCVFFSLLICESIVVHTVYFVISHKALRKKNTVTV